MSVAESVAVVSSVILKLWNRFQETWNLDVCQKKINPLLTTTVNDRYQMLKAHWKGKHKSTAKRLKRQFFRKWNGGCTAEHSETGWFCCSLCAYVTICIPEHTVRGEEVGLLNIEISQNVIWVKCCSMTGSG